MKYLYLFFFLVTCSFLAAQNADSLNIKHTRVAKEDTTAAKPKRTFNPVIMKAAIDSLILSNRDNQQFAQLRQTVFLYNSGYHVASLPEQDLYIVDHGFTVRQSPFGIGYELQKRIAFTNYTIQGRSISFDEIPYPYPAALSSTEFGIGGQDMNYAHLQIKKNELVGVDSLYGRFDALFQRGYWGGVSDNSTIEDIFFKYELKNGNLQLHANSLDWDIPPFQHALAQDEDPITTVIREKSELISLYWQNKWVNAGIQMNHVNWIVHSLRFGGVHDFNQILLDKELQFKPLTVQLRYEHFNGDDFLTERNQFVTPTGLDDLGTLNAKYETQKMLFISKSYGASPRAFGYDNEWQYRMFNNTSVILNCVGMKSFNNYIENFVFKNMVSNTTTLGLKFKNRHEQSIQVDGGFKSRKVGYLTHFVISFVDAKDKTAYFDVIVHVPISYHNWNAMINYKLEAPYFQSVLDVNAFYNLPYNNRILFGASHTFRDKTFLDLGKKDTYGLNDPYESQDNLLDAYAGLQITRQFDIRFTVKNVLDQYIVFNTNLMPITYLLTVKWDFVN